MNKQQAQLAIKSVFENSFEKKRFVQFVKNLLNNMEDAPFTYRGNYISDAYKQHISTLERIGKFNDGENRLDVLVVTLKKESSLERARTMQRNFIAWYLNGSRGGEMKDAALVAFISPDVIDWRFSLVKMDYKFEKTKTGRMKVKEEFTPARRWSFLVGANEKSHTAQSRLVNILANDEQPPNLEELEKAFDIETVTKEFFLEYRELFLQTKEELDQVVESDPKIREDFKKKNVDTVNFTKKLLGQIVFLYFLQKKGWFGVKRDDDWGMGSKHFIRELFEKKHSDYKNFFNDILEPLFYEALRVDRSHADGYYSRFNCKIPFLNGGLFDPIGNYDWIGTDIIIPNRLFSNSDKTEQGDSGNGILDVFDRYNFTVKEDEPLEKEVAIDPELLGKAYEKFNAIRLDNFDDYKSALRSNKKGDENRFNKKFGVYYTPREIVHYMCQQSLVNYLTTSLEGKVCKEQIEALIHTGEQLSENETTAIIKEQSIKEGKQKDSGYKLQLPESIRSNAALIDTKLANITVCDPAVGSGAFPVGMMSEIVRTRLVLTAFVQKKEHTSYEFKRRCIEHSLYGVDIDPGAVEIAKLRLWLSLVVDEDDIRNIKPLPNLDYRIMQGNSLISEFMGIDFDSKKENESLLFEDETDELIERFEQKKDELLNESNVTRKSELKEDVENLLIELFEAKLKTQKLDYFKQLKIINDKYSRLPNKTQRDECIKRDKAKLHKDSGFNLELIEQELKEFTSGKQTKPFFLWKLYFSEVFLNKGGFDVVIANPPYVFSREKISNADKVIFKKLYSLTQFKINLYILFIEKSYYLMNRNGYFSFIVPNNWLTLSTTSDLRHFILSTTRDISVVMNYDSVFENASVDTCILFFSKIGNSVLDAYMWTDKGVLKVSGQDTEFYLKNNNHVISNINAEDDINSNICENISSQSKPLSTFVEVRNGVQAYTVGEGTPVQTKKMKLNRVYHSNIKRSSEWIKYLDGVDVKRYRCGWSGQYIKYGKNLTRPRKPELFNGERLLVRQIPSKPPYSIHCCYIDENVINDNNSMIIKVVDGRISIKYLQSLINSHLISFWFIHTFGKLQRKTFPQFKVNELRTFPVFEIPSNDQKPFIQKVDQILEITKSVDYLENSQKQKKVKALELEIDQDVYELYNLTPEEIAVVESC